MFNSDQTRLGAYGTENESNSRQKALAVRALSVRETRRIICIVWNEPKNNPVERYLRHRFDLQL